MSSPDTNQPSQGGAISLELVTASPVTRAEAPSNSGSALAPALPALSAEQLRDVLAHMESALSILREEIKEGIEQIAPRVTDADALVDGLLQISKQASALNSWLLKAQLNIRFGRPFKD